MKSTGKKKYVLDLTSLISSILTGQSSRLNQRVEPLPGRVGPLKAIHPVEQQQEVKFYNREDPYYEFTNFYPCHVLIDDKTWPSTEHYFQAQKFVGTPYVEAIRHFPTAREAFQLSRTPQASRWCRGDWEQVKEDIMLKALRCKFGGIPELKKKLLETGNKRLIEHTHNDSYWGDGGDGSGKNKLGKLLERVRSELQSIHVQPLRDITYVPSSPRLKRSNSFTMHRRPGSDSISASTRTSNPSITAGGIKSSYLHLTPTPRRRSSSFTGSSHHSPGAQTLQNNSKDHSSLSLPLPSKPQSTSNDWNGLNPKNPSSRRK